MSWWVRLLLQLKISATQMRRNVKCKAPTPSVGLVVQNLFLNSGYETNFEVRWWRCKGGYFRHRDRVLALWRLDVETLDETRQKQKGHLKTKNLSETRTLS